MRRPRALTELFVVLSISAAALGAAGYLVRWLLAQPSSDPDMGRVASLVRDGAERFARGQSSIIGALAGVVGGSLFLAYGLRPAQGDVLPGFELGVWISLSFAIGAVTTLVLSQAATSIAARGSVRTAIAATRSVDAALQVAVRGGGAVALLLGAASTLTTGGLLFALLVYHGGLGDAPAAARALIPSAPWFFLGHALGATFTALLAQLSAGTFATATDIAADIGAREAGLDDDDPQNPAAIADLAGDCAARAGARAAASFATAVSEDLLLMVACSLAYGADTELRSALALVMLPLLARALGLLGTAFATFVVRTDERESPQAAITRGAAVAFVVHAFALVGAVEWLLPARRAALLGGAGIGAALGLVAVAATHYYVSVRFRPARDAADASRAGPTASLLFGLSTSLDAALIPFGLAAIAFAGGWTAGSALGGAAGGLLGLAAVGLGVSGTAGFYVALESAAAVIDAGTGIVGMTVAAERRDVRGRLLALQAPAATHRSVARVIPACTALAAVPLVALLVRHHAAQPAPEPTAAAGPWPLVAALLGAALVLWLFARLVSSVLRVSRRVLDEVRRQLRDRPPAEGDEPEGRSRARSARLADYGPCLEVAGRLAMRNMVLPGLLVVASLVAASVGLRFVSESDMGGAAVGSISSLIMGAMVVGSLGALLGTLAGGTWGNAKKYIVTGAHGGRLLVDETGARAENPTYQAAVVGDTVGDPLKDALAPALLMLVRLVPVLVLVLLPLLL
ncbi:MAG: sodium/proton-translocating pyrophosphatase [Myxococcales bacterium]|nr:sodium/proton-translocating pyrophosphatase [Myxococcales bacterium]